MPKVIKPLGMLHQHLDLALVSVSCPWCGKRMLHCAHHPRALMERAEQLENRLSFLADGECRATQVLRDLKAALADIE